MKSHNSRLASSLFTAALLLHKPHTLTLTNAFSLSASTTSTSSTSSTSTTSTTTTTTIIPKIHSIDNIPCRELDIHIQSLNDEIITILEATSEGQEKLVDAALMEEDDYDDDDALLSDVGVDKNIVREDPYGAVLWPAASAVSEYINGDAFWNDDDDGEQRKRQQQTSSLSSPSSSSSSSLLGRKPSLLELGTGTGLVALSASVSRKYSSVLATDYETVPLRLLDAAFYLNRERRDNNNGDDDNNNNNNNNNNDDDDDESSSTMTPITTSLFDICDLSTPLPPGDVICAADILYEPKTGIALARRTLEALERGSRVVVGCSPGRPGRPAFLEELKRLKPECDAIASAEFKDTEGTTCTGKRHSLICGEGSTSVSEEPEMLLVALMDLTPDCLGEKEK